MARCLHRVCREAHGFASLPGCGSNGSARPVNGTTIQLGLPTRALALTSSPKSSPRGPRSQH
eukprot:10485099-Alexandrium_andersonii.AAC.1